MRKKGTVSPIFIIEKGDITPFFIVQLLVKFLSLAFNHDAVFVRVIKSQL